MAAFRLDCLIDAGELDASDRQTAQADDADHIDAPPHGSDWCCNGCQPLYGMECGMCGYDGAGVWLDDTDTVAEYCCHCRARTYQSHDCICTFCGMDAENPGEIVCEDVAASPAASGPDCGNHSNWLETAG